MCAVVHKSQVLLGELEAEGLARSKDLGQLPFPPRLQGTIQSRNRQTSREAEVKCCFAETCKHVKLVLGRYTTLPAY